MLTEYYTQLLLSIPCPTHFTRAVHIAPLTQPQVKLWQLSGYPSEWSTPGSEWATADGYITCMNGLDNNIYSIGRGPSALTVEAPKTSIELGRSLIIDGTVMDISTGTKQAQQTADHPNGVPVASDSIMKDWMGYIYQQKGLPSNFTGVNVTLDVVDSNGNYRNIGTTTTDTIGTFSFQWTPDITGKYTVVATFGGTNSYWPSYSETSFAVDPAAPTPAPTQTPTQSMADTYMLPGIVAIIVAIAVVGAILALLVTKKATIKAT